MPTQVKRPSLTEDLLMLGDIYLTLAWMAVQRLRYGRLWPWETRSRRLAGSVVTLVRPEIVEEDAEESPQTAQPRRG